MIFLRWTPKHSTLLRWTPNRWSQWSLRGMLAITAAAAIVTAHYRTEIRDLLTSDNTIDPAEYDQLRPPQSPLVIEEYIPNDPDAPRTEYPCDSSPTEVRLEWPEF